LAKPKILRLMQHLSAACEEGRLRFTMHAVEQMHKRRISEQEVFFIIRHGFHEAKKDQLGGISKTWRYAIRGLTLDGRDLRVVVAFTQPNVLIVTAIDLNLKEG
jgi:hypothetical protein